MSRGILYFIKDELFKISVLCLVIITQAKFINSLEDDCDNCTSIKDFKEKLKDFINLNGGFESLGRATGERYQELYGSYPDYNRYPYQQGGKDENYYYNQQDNRLSYQNYGYGHRDVNYQQNNGQLNYDQYQGYYPQQGVYGQQNGPQNYGQHNYGQGGFSNPGYYPNRLQRPVVHLRPQNYQPGFMGALQSISRHDDLRCVPRLLCEVASAGKASPDTSQTSYIPFANKDSLVALLTVLNFVDDSPLMTFGRAALLGYTARGDNRACLQAYPTCPRDPDRLVEYLNNHNGGFFRFFGGSPGQNVPIQRPQYDQYLRPQYDSHRYPIGNQNRPQNYPYQYSPGYEQYRILSKPGIQSIFSPDSTLYQEPENFKFQTTPSRKGKKLSFPNERPFNEGNQYQNQKYQYYNDFAFRVEDNNLPINQYFGRPTPQFFPDRTGTGNLILDYNKLYPNYRPDPIYNKRLSNQILFPESNRYLNYNYRSGNNV